jgi:hypothetical protein
MGIGHPLLEKALHQAERLGGTVCAIDNLDGPVMVVHVHSRVTDETGQSRRTMLGITGPVDNFKLLRDWEVLRLLNRCNVKSERIAGSLAIKAVAEWRDAAMSALNGLPETIDLQLASKVVTEAALLWPAAK